MGWSALALPREAILNVRTGGWRSLLLGVVVAGAVGLVVFLELRQAEDATAFQRHYTRAGGFVAVVTGANTPLDAGRCAALHNRPDVLAAGGVRTLGTVSFTSAPGVLFQAAEVSGSGLAVWAPGSAALPGQTGPLALIGTVLAAELGVSEGAFLHVEGGDVVWVRAVIDAERRNPRMQRWFLTEGSPFGPTDECWVEFDPHSYAAGLASLGAWFASADDDPVIRPYIQQDEFTRDVVAEFERRPQRFGWALIAALTGVVYLLVSWFRRAELGLYLAVGTSRLDLLVMLGIEALVVVTTATIVGGGFAVGLHAYEHRVTSDHIRVAFTTAGAGALLALAVAPVASLVSARGNLASMLKER